jgi:hypothetical protein
MSPELHARLGPSNQRWPHCPGSVAAEEPYEDISGEAAIDGTGSHLLLELCIDMQVNAVHFLGAIIGENHHDKPGGWMVEQDRCDRVQMCLDYITGRRQQLEGQYPEAEITVEAESKSNPGGMFGRTDWWGTCDVTITVEQDARCLFMEVIDYKDGRGWVSADNNTQLISYLGGKLRPYFASGPQLVQPFIVKNLRASRMTIVQPKTNPPVRTTTIEGFELIDYMYELGDAANKTDAPDAPLIPDDKGGKGYCRWCKHKPNCTASAQVSVQEIDVMDSQLVVSSDLLTLTPDELQSTAPENLVKVLGTKAGFLAGYDRVQAEIERRLLADIPVDGYAMMPGKNSQVYNLDDDAIVKALKGRRLKLADIFPPNLITPAALMKSDKLKDDQKERFKKEFISTKVGADKLTRVELKAGEKSNQLSVDEMFGQVGDTAIPAQPESPAVAEAPSFF